MMQGQDLSDTRRRLVDRYRFYEERLAKVKKALEALDTVEQIDDLLSEPQQTTIPGTDVYASLGTKELILRVLEGRGRGCTLSEIIDAAERGGKSFPNRHTAYNGFYVAAQRLAEKNEIQIHKRKGRAVYRRVLESDATGSVEAM